MKYWCPGVPNITKLRMKHGPFLAIHSTVGWVKLLKVGSSNRYVKSISRFFTCHEVGCRRKNLWRGSKTNIRRTKKIKTNVGLLNDFFGWWGIIVSSSPKLFPSFSTPKNRGVYQKKGRIRNPPVRFQLTTTKNGWNDGIFWSRNLVVALAWGGGRATESFALK